MGWLSRLFPGSKKKEAASAPTASAAPAAPAAGGQSIPPAKVGLNGEFDESGMAKRVALAFDEDPELDDIDTLWVAQLSSKVVLKGKVPNQQILNKMVAVASKVDGATEVDTSEVTVG
ncbi:MAG: phospholipid-binding protein [Cyanobacteria bacterium RM1_2_2]|nr:phospholipid-binding protein [Cyanobacteria bacterium RM1_2_2]